MTFILHLETATKSCSVALSRDGSLLSIKESITEEFSHGENLTLYIQDVLSKAGIGIQQLSAVSIASGPGSYTGLRIGVSTAKGICYALNIPLISIDALVSLSNLAKEKHPNINLCAMIDARRMEVYCSIYTSSLETLKPIAAEIIDEESFTIFEPFVFFGDGAAKAQEIWKGRNCQFDNSVYSSAIGQISMAYEKYQKKDFEDVAYFEPFYLKDFVSTTKK
jgi:tRNA threonylcarbamoyladenosine biosynthesis protein TsaB